MWHFFTPYVPLAEKRARAEKKIAKLKKEGLKANPIKATTNHIGRSRLAKAWCTYLEMLPGSSASRFRKGKTCVRNGSIYHFEVGNGVIKALVMGSELYEVAIDIPNIALEEWQVFKESCQNAHSRFELISEPLSPRVIDLLCHEKQGLFPKLHELNFTCNCLDWTEVCKHVIATLYGFAVWLDSNPEALFTLRGTNLDALIEVKEMMSSIAYKPENPDRYLTAEQVSDIFDIDIQEPVITKTIKDINADKMSNFLANKRLSGMALKKRRKTLGLTKAACAQMIGVSVSSLTRWELFGRKKIRATQQSMDKIYLLWGDLQI